MIFYILLDYLCNSKKNIMVTYNNRSLRIFTVIHDLHYYRLVYIRNRTVVAEGKTSALLISTDTERMSSCQNDLRCKKHLIQTVEQSGLYSTNLLTSTASFIPYLGGQSRRKNMSVTLIHYLKFAAALNVNGQDDQELTAINDAVALTGKGGFMWSAPLLYTMSLAKSA